MELQKERVIRNFVGAKKHIKCVLDLVKELPDWVSTGVGRETNIRSIERRIIWIYDFLKLVTGED